MTIGPGSTPTGTTNVGLPLRGSSRTRLFGTEHAAPWPGACWSASSNAVSPAASASAASEARTMCRRRGWSRVFGPGDTGGGSCVVTEGAITSGLGSGRELAPLRAPTPVGVSSAGSWARIASLKSLQGSTGLDPELVDERLPCLLVGVEGFRLPVGAVEREHLLGAEAFAERMLANEHLQLAEHVLVTTLGEVAIDPVHEQGQPQLVEAAPLRPVRTTRERARPAWDRARTRAPPPAAVRLPRTRRRPHAGVPSRRDCACGPRQGDRDRRRAGSRRPRSRSGRDRRA